MIMNPETRNIQQVVVDNDGETTVTINNLMGKDSGPKKKFVFSHKITEIV